MYGTGPAPYTNIEIHYATHVISTIYFKINYSLVCTQKIFCEETRQKRKHIAECSGGNFGGVGGLTGPKIKLTGPKIKLTGPKIKLTGPKIKLTGPKIKLTGPKIKLTGPKIKLTGPKIKLTGPKIKLTDPKIKLTGPKQWRKFRRKICRKTEFPPLAECFPVEFERSIVIYRFRIYIS